MATALQQAMMQQIMQSTQASAQVQAWASLYNSQAQTGGWMTSTVTNTATTSVVCPTWPNGTATTSTIGNNVMNALYSSQGLQMAAGTSALVHDTLRLLGECEIADGEPCKVRLPDGGMLEVDADGSYRINDKDAKVIYRANRMRDFNSFINASDKLESFIKFCGELGVRQDEMLNIPVKHFIAWLIVEAARADGEQPEEKLSTALPVILRKIAKPKCVGCGRFIPRKLTARKITFCRPVCLERELAA